MKTLVVVAMVTHMFSPDVSNVGMDRDVAAALSPAMISVVDHSEDPAVNLAACERAARATADSLGAAGVNAIVSCAVYPNGEVSTYLADAVKNTVSAYRSVTE